MSSEGKDKIAASRGKKKAADNETRYIKVRKALSFLFTQDGLKEREIHHEADDEVAVEDILASEHFSKQFTAEDFDHAVAKDCTDLILKAEPHFLLVTRDGRKLVKYHKEPLEYKDGTNVVPLNDKANVGLSQETVAVEKSSKQGENEEKEQQNLQSTGGNKKKKNKKNNAGGTGGSQGGADKNQSKENEESPVSNVRAAREETASAESKTKAETVSSNNVKSQSEPTDATRETIDENESLKSASEDKDLSLKDNSELESNEGFNPVGGKKGSKKSNKKKGKQSEASGIKNSGNETQQNKQAAELLEKAGKQPERSSDKAGKKTEQSLPVKPIEQSPGKQTKVQKVTESHQKNSDKQNKKSENLQKKPTDDANSAALSSDEEKTSSSSPDGPPKKKLKPEDRLKKIPNTFNFLFGKGGLLEKKIAVGEDGFVKVKSILEVFHSQYQWTETEITDTLANNPGYTFELDDKDGLLVKAVEQKKQAVEQPVVMKEPDDWKETGRRREGQRPQQNSNDFHLSKQMSYILRHGAEKLQLPIQKDGFLLVDDLLSCKNLQSFTPDDVRRVVLNNDKQRFFLTEDPQSGKLKVRANQGHTVTVPDLELQPIDSASDVPIVVHGTYKASWQIIAKQGLSTMGRTHIHFAAGEPGADGVISGMRVSSEVLIFVDLEKALKDGLKFYRSANNVILSPGDNKGLIGPEYFKSVIQRHPRVKLI